ncbi:MAG TPA: hypothetical protein PLL10_04970 [Elusimicrobiales bacterium]|nr:hypothetical protein [Elusimicrobiales bacterium]
MANCHKYNYLLLAGVAAAMLGGVAVASFLAKKRREALQKFAAASGFSFDPDALSIPPELLPLMSVFKAGSSRNFCNLLSRSSHGQTLLAFDYSYTTGSGKNRHTHTQTVIAFSCDQFLPQFQLCPENLGHKLLQLFGYRDIDFTETPEFSKSYLLRGPEETSVRSFFSMEARNMLQSAPGWTMEGAAQWLVLYKAGGTQKAEDLQAYIEQARTMASSFGLRIAA